MNKLSIAAVVILGLAVASCNQMELCHSHPHSHVLNINAEWDQKWEYRYEGSDWITQWEDANLPWSYDELRPEVPGGLRSVIYRPDGQVENVNIYSIGGELMLQKGLSSILLYNNDTEDIVFNDFTSAMMVIATTRARARVTYMGSPYSDEEEEYTVNEPDMLYGFYIKDYNANDDETREDYAVRMRPLVFSYVIRFHFEHGMQYVALARGALSGMARSVYLLDGHTDNEKASVLFDCESAAEQLQDTGNTVTVIVHSFGAPNYPNPYYNSRDNGKYGLNLELRLKNGKILSYDYDISEQINSQPRGGVIEIPGVSVSDSDGKEATGQFGVDVNDWGDFEDVPLDL